MIKTPRLELIAGNHEMAVAEMNNIINLSAILQAEFSYGWPPPGNNEKTMEWFFNRIYDNPHHRGWLIWYFIQVQNGKRYVIGNGGFTGPPNDAGVVECGYAILTPMQGNGFAGEALGGLLSWAFAHKKVQKIKARAKPGNIPSIKVLQNNGFTKTGHDPKNDCFIFETDRKM